MSLALFLDRVVQVSPNNELYQYVVSTYTVDKHLNFCGQI